MEYVGVLNNMYEKAEELGRTTSEAWLLIEEVWWPNPHYTGNPVQHPQSEHVFHPAIVQPSEDIRKWLFATYPGLLQEVISYINIYMQNNDEATYEEAFESVDSVLYSEWFNS